MAFYRVACDRYIHSIPENAARIAEAMARAKATRAIVFGQAPAPAEELDAQLGLAPGATARSRASRELSAHQKEVQEYAARVKACVEIADSFEFSRGDEALPYYDAVCELQPLSGSRGNGQTAFDIDVDHGCESGKIIRENLASRTRFRAQFAAQMQTALQNAATNIGQSVLTYQAAKRGQIYVPPGPGQGSPGGVQPASTSPTGAVAPGSRTSGGACPDSGRGCASDPGVQAWKGKCESGTQAACYCAAAATSQCFLSRGCYAEAGALRADGSPTSVTQSTLQSGVTSNSAKASQLGTTCSPGAAVATGVPAPAAPDGSIASPSTTAGERKSTSVCLGEDQACVYSPSGTDCCAPMACLCSGGSCRCKPGPTFEAAPATPPRTGGSTPSARPDPATTCTPRCEDRACGADGCGGSCGTCAEGSICTDSGRCDSPEARRVMVSATPKYVGDTVAECCRNLLGSDLLRNGALAKVCSERSGFIVKGTERWNGGAYCTPGPGGKSGFKFSCTALAEGQCQLPKSK